MPSEQWITVGTIRFLTALDNANELQVLDGANYVQRDGNVGIGTDNPQAKLHIQRRRRIKFGQEALIVEIQY